MLYKIEEVAAMFQISRSHAYRMKREQNWPHHVFGSEIRFSVEDIQAIQAMHHKKPDPQPEPGRRKPRIGTRAQKR